MAIYRSRGIGRKIIVRIADDPTGENVRHKRLGAAGAFVPSATELRLVKAFEEGIVFLNDGQRGVRRMRKEKR